MTPRPPIAAGLHAALRVACGHADGLALIRTDDADAAAMVAARSFWALPLAVPAFVALQAIAWIDTGLPPDAAHAFALDFISSFVIGWLGFAALSHTLAGRFGRAPLWPRYLALWNWCNLVQDLILVLAALPDLLGLPDWITETMWLVGMGWVLWLEWFATRLALAISGPEAAALVAADVLFNVLLGQITGSSG